MSDANNSWRFELDGRRHEVNLDVTMMGKWTVTVDGTVVVQDRKWIGNEETFEIAGHPARIKVSLTLGGFSAESELFIDGSYMEPLAR